AGRLADDLRALDITADTLQQLVDGHGLEDATEEQVLGLLKARRTALLRGDRPAAERRPVPAGANLGDRLEHLLGGADLQTLDPATRREALGLFRQLTPDDLARLSAAALWNLARLLRA